MRKIEPKLVSFIDMKLSGNGLAQVAIEKKMPRQLMIEAAKTLVGIRETTGRNDGPMVELIQETVGGHSREAWCMALVQSCIAYAELKTGVKSPVVPSEHCMTTWNNTPKVQRVLVHPLPGAIAIWRHGNTTSGHTGIVLGADSEEFQAIEGNTTSGSNGPNEPIVREGGGCYFTERSMQNFPDIKSANEMKLVGFLKPF